LLRSVAGPILALQPLFAVDCTGFPALERNRWINVSF